MLLLVSLVLTSPTTWTATGGGFTFRYVILYDQATSTPIGYWDYSVPLTLGTGDTFTANLDVINGVFSVA